MKRFAKTGIARLWMVVLLAGLSMVTVSAVASAVQIGDEYGGGKIAWLDPTGQHGLIAAKADCPGPYFTWQGAKKACQNYKANGYRDWRLPSKNELNKLYRAKSTVGGFFTDVGYWSSTENGALNAWYQYFNDGFQVGDHKYDINRVRAVRAF